MALLLARLGFNMRPPLFAMAAVTGLLVWCLEHIILGPVFHWTHLIQPLDSFLTTAVLVGIFTGCLYAAMYAREAKRLELPTWDDYSPPEGE